MKFEITATARSLQGTGASRRLRREGKVPAIVYGAEKTPSVIALDHNEFYHQIKNEAFHASVLTLNIDGAKEQVLLRDFQMHPFKRQILHVDLQRVSQTEKIHVKVPLHFINADTAPGVKLSGGNVTHIFNEMDIECLAKDLPEYVEVDLGNLQAGHSIHLSEIKLPEGVEFMDLQKGDDKAVAAIVVPRGVAEEAAAASATPAK